MIIKGFRFGMLLQFAIGPVCLFVFKTANEYGIPAAEAAVVAATLADVLFVTLAIVGVGTVLERPGVKMVLKYFGTAVLMYFGTGVILGAFGIRIIPTLGGSTAGTQVSNAFVTSFVLTISSPLSILFWTGVFANKLASDGFDRRAMVLFGGGAVLATLVFLTIVAVVTGILHIFISPTVVKVLNIGVGSILIGFGIKMLLRKMPPPVKENAYV